MAAPLSLADLTAVVGIVKRRWYAKRTDEELPAGWYWCGDQAHGFRVSVRVSYSNLTVTSELKIKNAAAALEAGSPGGWENNGNNRWSQLMPADYVLDTDAYIIMINEEVEVRNKARTEIDFKLRNDKRLLIHTLDERVAYEDAAVLRHYAERTKAQLAAAWDALNEDSE